MHSLNISDFDIAIELISWPARIDGGWIDTHHPTSLVRDFTNHLCHRHKGMHRETVEHAVDEFLQKHRTLRNWWLAVLKCGDISLKVFDRRPYIPIDALHNWRSAIARLDQDALITLELSARDDSKDAHQILEELKEWRTMPEVWSRDLGSLLQRGIADTHVHLEACHPMSVLWGRLVTDDLRLEYFDRYRSSVIDNIRHNSERHTRRLMEKKHMMFAKKYWTEYMLKNFSRNFLNCLKNDNSITILKMERFFLINQWRIVELYFSDNSKYIQQRKNSETREKVQKFDRYLYAKSQFLREHQQFPESSAGLSQFREYLDRGVSPEERARTRRCPRARQVRFRRLLEFASEAEHLQALELRIAPQKTLKDWASMMRIWDSARKQVANAPERIGFIVHFIRPGRQKMIRDGGPEDARQVLDRMTALLHLFRHRHHELAEPIIGIDVANLERGSPPHLFIPYLRLLRGDHSMLSPYRETQKCWQKLRYRNLHRHSFFLPRLGVTYHAGEDFYHLVTGLRHIDQLSEFLLEPGDRVGHGLALGVDPEYWLDRSRGTLMMPQGVLLDDIVWLRRILLTISDLPLSDKADLDRGIAILSQRIYSQPIEPVQLEMLAAERCLLPPAKDKQPPDGSVESLYYRDVWDPNTAKQRSIFANTNDLDYLNGRIKQIRKVQQYMCRKLGGRHIYVETNPTSNVATGLIRRYADHPMFFMKETTQGKAHVTVNTDDPGVFLTRIDQEYALLYNALRRDKGRDVADTLAFLEDLRASTLDSTFLPRTDRTKTLPK